jgi:DNA polymerase III sliding clamp (beta) subunit (PCNA family)
MKRADLVQTLEHLKPALASTNMVPCYQCFLFDGESVTATNDEIAIIAAFKADQAFATKGEILLGLLKNTRTEDVKFSLEEHDVHVAAGRSIFKLPFIPKSEFLFEEPQIVQFETVLPINADLLGGLEACLLTASDDNTQAALMGITISKGSILFGCDSDAVTRSKQRVQANDAPDRLIPTDFCKTVVRLITATEARRGEFCISEDWAMATIDNNYRVYGRIAKVDKPLDHQNLIDETLKKQKVTFVDVPKGFDRALSRARVIADPESGKTVLTVEGDRLKLVTETSMGIVRDSVAIGHQPVTANVSAELVQRAISLCDQMAILDSCTVYRAGNQLFQLLSNMN